MGMPLKQMTTEHLLGSLRRIRIAQSRGADWDMDPALGDWFKLQQDCLEQEAVILKAELATRPHLPRRAENRTRRQEAARKARGQGKSRNR